MRKKLLIPIACILLLFSCKKEDELDKPTTFIASDGTYIGVVHLAYEEVSGAENYIVYRLNNETAEWQEINWNPSTIWDDQGFMLTNNKITPGQKYQYKFNTHAEDPGFGPYSEIETGYAFDPKKATITEVTRDYEKSENLIVWTDPNDYDPIQNLVSKEYILYSTTEDNLTNFRKLTTTTNLSYKNYINSYDVDKVFYYKIVTKYTYLINDQHGSSFHGYYEIESDLTKEGSGGDGPDIVSYTKTDLGTIVTSGDAITFTEIKQTGSNIYLGILKNVNIVGYGSPAVYTLNGNSWAETGGTLPSYISSSTSISKMGIAASTSKTYLAALESDSIYILESDGSTWSNNLAVGNLGFTDAPSAMDIEVLNNELYLAAKVYPDWDLKIFKWTGSVWETVGGDGEGFITSSLDVSEVTLNNFGETLYLSYLVKNSDYNHTLHIKHLNGSSWESDLEWTADNIMSVKIAKGSTDIYISSSTQAFANYKGGVYKVASSSTVEELISDNDNWFYTPYGLTVDSDGKVIICSHKLVSESVHYPFLNLYDGSKWNTISGDFSDGIKPVSVHADGTNIIYVYSDKNNTTSWNQTKSIKSIKFTK